MRNPEAMLERRERADALTILYEKARELLDEEAINPKTFADLYGPRQVEKDCALVTSLEKKFSTRTAEDRESAQKALILEAIINEQIELNEWFGQGARTIRPSRYDDFVNGVDTVVEFDRQEQGMSHLGLATDITFGSHIIEKLRRIKTEIKSGALTRIKYFQSEAGGFRGEYRGIPRIIIGADSSHVADLIQLWSSKQRTDRTTLAKHPFQFKMLEEARLQLETYRRYARDIGQEPVAQTYDKTLAIVTGVMRAKDGHYNANNFIGDNLFARLRRELEQFDSL